MQQLDPRAVWLFFFRHLFVIAALFVFLSPILTFPAAMMLFVLGIIGAKSGSIFGASAYILLFIIVVFGVSYILSRLSYSFYKYELTDNGFRKESGIIWKRYVTIPYDRIQNVDIYRGVLTRILGLSDLHIQTAGFSSGNRYGMSAEGILPGLSMEIAEQLRNEFVQRASHSRAQGL